MPRDEVSVLTFNMLEFRDLYYFSFFLEKAWQVFHSHRHFEIKPQKTNPKPKP